MIVKEALSGCNRAATQTKNVVNVYTYAIDSKESKPYNKM